MKSLSWLLLGTFLLTSSVSAQESRFIDYSKNIKSKISAYEFNEYGKVLFCVYYDTDGKLPYDVKEEYIHPDLIRPKRIFFDTNGDGDFTPDEEVKLI